MMFTVVTNNDKIKKNVTETGQKVVFVDGHAKDVIVRCFDLIYEGRRLVADPLAGYLSRPNPYHTIFLADISGGKVKGEDLIRLHRALEQWDRYDNHMPLTDRMMKDYEELDYSIASSTFEGLMQTPDFYCSIS